MPTYDKPNPKMQAAFDRARALPAHKDRLSGVRISVHSVHATLDKDDEPRGEAISRDGKPLFGKTRITPAKERAAMFAISEEEVIDACVYLHGDRWGELSSRMQVSIIDGCLTRIEVQTEDGGTKRDDLGRPKLRLRKYEMDFRGFHEVAERHGNASLEVQAIKLMVNDHGQIYLPHLDPDATPVMRIAARPKPKRALGDGRHKSGSLGVKLLRERLQHIEQPETILAVAQLEYGRKKPRAKIIDALKDRVLELKILEDFNAVEEGNPTSRALDLAAAVLVTTPKDPPVDLLDRLVPDCRDEVVLSDILGDEDAKAEPRENVIAVVEARLKELRPR